MSIFRDDWRGRHGILLNVHAIADRAGTALAVWETTTSPKGVTEVSKAINGRELIISAAALTLTVLGGTGPHERLSTLAHMSTLSQLRQASAYADVLDPLHLALHTGTLARLRQVNAVSAMAMASAAIALVAFTDKVTPDEVAARLRANLLARAGAA